MRRWLPVAAYLFVVVMGAVGLWQVQGQADDLRESVETEQRRNCRILLAARDETEATLIRVAIDLGADDGTMAVIRRGYDELPTPSDC